MKRLTLAEFRASGRDCNLHDVLPGMEFTYDGRGRSYADGSCYIERSPGGWYLILGNCEYESTPYPDALEDVLYRWYLGEIASPPDTLVDHWTQPILDAMNNCEELGGPEALEYLAIMARINQETEKRITNYLAILAAQ